MKYIIYFTLLFSLVSCSSTGRSETINFFELFKKDDMHTAKVKLKYKSLGCFHSHTEEYTIFIDQNKSKPKNVIITSNKISSYLNYANIIQLDSFISYLRSVEHDTSLTTEYYYEIIWINKNKVIKKEEFVNNWSGGYFEELIENIKSNNR